MLYADIELIFIQKIEEMVERCTASRLARITGSLYLPTSDKSTKVLICAAKKFRF